MPPRKQIGVPSAALTRQSSRVASRKTATAPKASKTLTARRNLNPRAQAAIEEELAEENQNTAADQDADEEEEASTDVDQEFCYGNKDEHISIGRGLYLLGTTHIPSQYPSPYNLRFEVMAGDAKVKRSGGVRLIGTAGHTYIIPFVNIEQVIILPEPKARGPNYHRVLIVPTAAAGFSAIKRKYPKIISFSLPNKSADKKLQGKYGKAADARKDTYLSVFKKVFHQKLKPFGKSVLDATDIQKAGIWEGKTTAKFGLKDQPNERTVEGHSYFLHEGLVFLYDFNGQHGKENLHLFIPFTSFSKSLLLLAYEKKEPVAVRYLIEDLSEPYFAATASANKDEQKSLVIVFDNLPVELLDKLKKWSEENGIKTMRMDQLFYDYAENSPATGFMPPGMMGMM